MLDYEKESILSFKQAAEYVPRGVHYNTICQWADNGVKGVILDSIRIGRRRFTSKEAIQRFIEEKTQEHEPLMPELPRHERRGSADRWARELERRFGI